MPGFLYQYTQFFSYIGDGTPEDPGGDFGMHCWIEAPDSNAALEWGYALLGDYCQKRFAHCEDAEYHDGRPIRDGEIETDCDAIASLNDRYIAPQCKLGEFPKWEAPWRHSNLIEKTVAATGSDD